MTLEERARLEKRYQIAAIRARIQVQSEYVIKARLRVLDGIRVAEERALHHLEIWERQLSDLERK